MDDPELVAKSLTQIPVYSVTSLSNSIQDRNINAQRAVIADPCTGSVVLQFQNASDHLKSFVKVQIVELL